MANTIKPKRSYTTSNTPTLVAGELGINAADKKIWIGNAAGNANVLIASLSLSDMTGSVSSATTATNLASGGAGQLPYQSASGTTAMLSAGTSGQYLKSNGAAAPSWSALPSVLPVYTRSGSTTNVSVANGSFSVTLRGGSTVNVTVS